MNIALSIFELVSVVMEFSERMIVKKFSWSYIQSMLVSIVDRVSLGRHPSPKGSPVHIKVTFLNFVLLGPHVDLKYCLLLLNTKILISISMIFG